MRLINNEIELHGDSIESKKKTAVDIRPGKAIDTYRYQVHGGNQQKERQT